jgi:hypothetical protein
MDCAIVSCKPYSEFDKRYMCHYMRDLQRVNARGDKDSELGAVCPFICRADNNTLYNRGYVWTGGKVRGIHSKQVST